MKIFCKIVKNSSYQCGFVGEVPPQTINISILNRYFAKNYLQMQGQNRNEIKVGATVGIVLKEDQRTGKITEGIVKDILTKSMFHPHGIKVRLSSGEVGRVKLIR